MRNLLLHRFIRLSAAPLACVLAILFLWADSAPRLSAEEAAQHVGEVATVCGKVVSAKYASSTRGQPTFLNLDKAYPSQIFTVVIWGSNRRVFGSPETTLRGKRICVTGAIELYKGKAEIIAKSPTQISVEKSE